MSPHRFVRQIATVAEGVENAEVAGALRVLGCNLIQGYFYARPQPPAEIEPLLRRWDAAAALASRNDALVAPVEAAT